MKFVVGILAMILGVIMVIKTEWFIQNLGSNAWAEAHLGSEGGSRLMYKLIGIGIFIVALLGMTGLLGNIILGVFGGLFGLS